MVDAAYYRRQAATCRAVAPRFKGAARLIELAEYFDRRAAMFELPSEASSACNAYDRPRMEGQGRGGTQPARHSMGGSDDDTGAYSFVAEGRRRT